MAVSDFYTARWPDFICISAHYKYHDDDDDDDAFLVHFLIFNLNFSNSNFSDVFCA